MTPFMTAVLRGQFEIAGALLKNNLATRGYVNRDGRDVRQIAEDANQIRALNFLDDGELKMLVLKRDSSVDNVPSQSAIKGGQSPL